MPHISRRQLWITSYQYFSLEKFNIIKLILNSLTIYIFQKQSYNNDCFKFIDRYVSNKFHH
jgi:hypothetical protein